MWLRTAPYLAALFFVVAAFGPQAASAGVPTPIAVSTYARLLHHINPHLRSPQSRELARQVIVQSGRWKVDTNLLVALVTVESHWRVHAVSRVGALGLGQLMPHTAALLGVNPRAARDNLRGTAHFLSSLIERYENHPNTFQLACAAYNAGPQAVKRYGGIPPFRETRNYVRRVMSTWQRLNATVPAVQMFAHATSGQLPVWGRIPKPPVLPPVQPAVTDPSALTTSQPQLDR